MLSQFSATSIERKESKSQGQQVNPQTEIPAKHLFKSRKAKHWRPRAFMKYSKISCNRKKTDELLIHVTSFKEDFASCKSLETQYCRPIIIRRSIKTRKSICLFSSKLKRNPRHAPRQAPRLSLALD